jgi:fermentation-respiration switch protein FrsA (DUF1100 family)
VTLQTRIIDVATSGSGAESLPADMRAGANSPSFRSWLLFDPAVVMPKIKQPVLIMHARLDREIDTAHADRLETLARGRKKATPTDTRRVTLEGVNHLLVPAATGEVDEYPTLATRDISTDVSLALIAWLRDTLPAR